MLKCQNALPGPTNASNTVNSAQQLEPHSHLHPLVSTKRGHAVPPHHQHNQAEAQCKCWSNASTELDSHLSAGLDMGSLSAHAKLKCPAPNQARPSSSPTSAWASNPTQPQELECSKSQIASFGTAPHQSSHKMQQCDKFKHFFAFRLAGCFGHRQHSRTSTCKRRMHCTQMFSSHRSHQRSRFLLTNTNKQCPGGCPMPVPPQKHNLPAPVSLHQWGHGRQNFCQSFIHCATLLSVKIRAHVSPTMRLFSKSLIC